jgi:hypothetical protein
MNIIDQFFDRMDDWRHFPNYQLERRADLVFSLYLGQVLHFKTKDEIADLFVPEFPVRIGTIYPDIPIDKSYKIDYVALSKSGNVAYLVELKTEGASRRESQDKYLYASQAVGMTALLEGVLRIFRATQAKRKYYYLLKQLEAMGLLEIPTDFEEAMRQKSLKGVNQASESVHITSEVSRCEVLYIQPNGDDEQVVSFATFADIIEKNEDPFANRFAQSLREWAEVEAGRRGFI